jgi:hypothetical protein
VCPTMLCSLIFVKNPFEAQVAVMDVRLQILVFTGELSTATCWDMLVAMRLMEATVINLSPTDRR